MVTLRYDVKIDGMAVAENMNIETALMLVEAIFNRYFEQALAGLEVSVVSREGK